MLSRLPTLSLQGERIFVSIVLPEADHLRAHFIKHHLEKYTTRYDGNLAIFELANCTPETVRTVLGQYSLPPVG